jgi:hypothetical protein
VKIASDMQKIGAHAQRVAAIYADFLVSGPKRDKSSQSELP